MQLPASPLQGVTYRRSQKRIVTNGGAA